VIFSGQNFCRAQSQNCETKKIHARPARKIGGHSGDVEIAYKWYSIAVAQGAGRARENLTNIEQHITAEQIATAKQLSAAFVPRK
jgi:hypothetical protein